MDWRTGRATNLWLSAPHPLHVGQQQWDVIYPFGGNGKGLAHVTSLLESSFFVQIYANREMDSQNEQMWHRPHLPGRGFIRAQNRDLLPLLPPGLGDE